jgi:hypothetical protein
LSTKTSCGSVSERSSESTGKKLEPTIYNSWKRTDSNWTISVSITNFRRKSLTITDSRHVMIRTAMRSFKTSSID